MRGPRIHVLNVTPIYLVVAEICNFKTKMSTLWWNRRNQGMIIVSRFVLWGPGMSSQDLVPIDVEIQDRRTFLKAAEAKGQVRESLIIKIYPLGP